MGKVTKVLVISGIGYGCDEEAVRLVKMFQFQVEKTRKLRVTFKKDIHIHFRKPKITKTKKVIQYKYQTVAPQPVEEDSKKPEKKKGYSYTIKY